MPTPAARALVPARLAGLAVAAASTPAELPPPQDGAPIGAAAEVPSEHLTALELSPASLEVAAAIARRLSAPAGGAALVIDYGYTRPAGHTLQVRVGRMRFCSFPGNRLAG